MQLWPLNGEGAAGAQDTGTLKAFQEDLLAQLRPVDWAAVVFTSATTRQRLPRILEAVAEAGAQHRRRVTTATLNLVVREAVGWRSPPSLRGDPRKGRIYYSTQVGPLPPLIPHLPASFMLGCLNNRRGAGWRAIEAVAARMRKHSACHQDKTSLRSRADTYTQAAWGQARVVGSGTRGR